nr:MAG TPA: hypothetical protein [Herelleviridae sp.]
MRLWETIKKYRDDIRAKALSIVNNGRLVAKP